MQLHFNNDIRPFPLSNGNPVGNNQFGHHPVFTGIPQMSSGDSLSIPFYDGQYGLGPFACMCTVVINRKPYQCSGGPTATFVYSHASVMYIDPLVQLWNITGACNWGRIIVDTGWTRYNVEPMRTGSHRFAANVVVWLLNIEKIFSWNLTSGGTPPPPMKCNSNTTNSTDDADQTQVLGCSNGDALTLKSPTMMCNVGFAGADAPSCLALVVTETAGTTCVVDLQTAKIGTYWIVVDGKNTSLQFSVTAASLTPRGTVTAVTGACIKTSPTAIAGCRDGSSVTIDWTLPYPRDLTLGIGSTATVCQSFSVSGTQVTCVFKGLNTMARGRYQTYINGVATGIPLTVQTDIAGLNKVLCSGTKSFLPTASATDELTATESRTGDETASRSLLPTPSATSTASLSGTVTVTVSVSRTATGDSSGSVTETRTEPATVTRAASATRSGNASFTVHLVRSVTPTTSRSRTRPTRAVTRTHTAWLSASAAVTATVRAATATGTVRVSATRSWACVDAGRLAAVLAPYAAAALRVVLSDDAVRNGTTAEVTLAPVSGLADAELHVPWFEPWEAAAYVVVVDAPNQRGFAERTGTTAGIRLSFPRGLGAVAGSDAVGVPAVVVVPPLRDYVIYGAETVTLELALADATLGWLCGAGNGSAAAGARLGLVRLVVMPSEDSALAAAQALAAPILATVTAATPMAAPALQAMVMVALMPCTDRASFQRRTLGMFRALSLFTLDETYEGVLWGNLIANVAWVGVHCAVVAGVAVRQRQGLADAMAAARFPGAYLTVMWYMTYAGSLFAALQLLSGDSGTEAAVSDTTRALAAVVMGVFCVAVPGAIAFYILRRAEAYFRVYEYHKWRRGDTALRVRLLSTALLPVGRWEPEGLRRRLGAAVTNQCRPEFYWMLLPLASPLAVALFALVRNQSERVCVWVYLLLAALHVALIAVVLVCRPLRTVLETGLKVATLALMALYLVFSAVLMVYPLDALKVVLSVVPNVQFALLAAWGLYNICHFFIARRIATAVPSRVLFEWHRGQAEVDDTVGGSGGMSGPTMHDTLYSELNDLLTLGDDNGAEMLTKGLLDEDSAALEPPCRPLLAAEVDDAAFKEDNDDGDAHALWMF